MSEITIEPEKGSSMNHTDFKFGVPYKDTEGGLYVNCYDGILRLTKIFISNKGKPIDHPAIIQRTVMQKDAKLYRPYHGKVTIEFGEDA